MCLVTKHGGVATSFDIKYNSVFEHFNRNTNILKKMYQAEGVEPLKKKKGNLSQSARGRYSFLGLDFSLRKEALVNYLNILRITFQTPSRRLVISVSKLTNDCTSII